MTELILFSLFNSFVFQVSQPRKILYPAVEWLQMHAPVWVPREILFDCLLCTCFWWMAIPETLVINFIYPNYWCVLLPFAITALTVFFYPK